MFHPGDILNESLPLSFAPIASDHFVHIVLLVPSNKLLALLKRCPHVQRPVPYGLRIGLKRSFKFNNKSTTKKATKLPTHHGQQGQNAGDEPVRAVARLDDAQAGLLVEVDHVQPEHARDAKLAVVLFDSLLQKGTHLARCERERLRLRPVVAHELHQDVSRGVKG